MRCDAIMNRNVRTLTPDAPAEEAARVMRDSDTGFLPVCQGDRVIGTVTDRDIVVRLLAEAKPPQTRLADVMTKKVVGCRPDDDVARAEELMKEHQVSRIVCCDDGGKLVGVISLADVTRNVGPGDTGGVLRAVKQPVGKA